MTDRKRSKAEERSFARMLADLEQQEAAIERLRRSRSLVPPDWQAAPEMPPGTPPGTFPGPPAATPPKTKLNIALDRDMVAWFRALGRGYQRRMNAVLRAYMESVIAKEIARTTAP